MSTALRPLNFQAPYLDDYKVVVRLSLRRRLKSWAAVHARSLVLIGVLLLGVGVVHGVGMFHSPGIDINDDEGTYVSEAWAVGALQQLSHYTYWYDHPPLGWLQLAGYANLTDAWSRAPFSVAVGREFMLVVNLAACAALFVLARRLGLSRVAAAGAVVLFAASPLSVEFHRMVWLDNIAVAWLLAAFACAASRRRSLASGIAAGVCFAVAVLSKETVALFAPFLLWVAWQHSEVHTRRYRIAAFTTVAAALTVFYPLYAAVKNELLEGPGHVSLLWALRWQLALRKPNGSVLEAGSGARYNVETWLRLDPWLLVLGLTAAVLALAVHRLRPFGLAVLLHAAMTLRQGYLPWGYVVAVLPFAALLVAGLSDRLLRAASTRRPLLRAIWMTPAVAAAAFITAAWVPADAAQMRRDSEVGVPAAVAWMRDNVGPDKHIVVDDNVWLDLVQAGYPMKPPEPSVVWVYKLGLDPAIRLRSVDYLVYAMNPTYAARDIPQVVSIFRDSYVVRTFGSGQNIVTVRKVVHTRL
jgi:hypothetical protein